MTAFVVAAVGVLVVSAIGAVLVWRARPDPGGVRAFRRRFPRIVRMETVAYYYGDGEPWPGVDATQPLTILDVDYGPAAEALVEGARDFGGTILVVSADGSLSRVKAPPRPVADKVAVGMFRVPLWSLSPAPGLTDAAARAHPPRVSADGRLDGSSP